jgi:drug/metabolite transporter (DMT)-like permease
MQISFGYVLLLLAYAALMATANLLLEAGAARIAQGGTIVATIVANLSNVFLWLGLSIYAFAFFLWVWLLSFIPLRFALPLAMTSIVIAPLLSGIINKSFPQPLYWVGLALVMGGVSLVLAK